MKISHGTRVHAISPTNGYGYATDRMLHTLSDLGHSVKTNDPDAEVQIWFDQPQHWEWNNNDQYRIGYHPWESTELKPGWLKKLNECDEVWTPSYLIADWYRAGGVTPPVYVYEHGVDPVWQPRKRIVGDRLRFLHLGAEAARKGGLEVMRAFRTAARGRDDVELTLKMINPGFNLPAIGPTTIINKVFSLEETVDLFHSHHVYVYPSWGEGFGMTPLQALATGMPTITVPAWAPYKDYLDPNLTIKSSPRQSPWPFIHPGQMLCPSLDELVDRLRWVMDHYDAAQEFAMSQAGPVAARYDWKELTNDTFMSLENRLQTR